jgi:DNA-binding beta-propeller fold protein YncE
MALLTRSLALFAAACACLLACCAAAAAGPLYRIESAQTFKSAGAPSWDYLAFDDVHSILYISRRDDGVLAYDARARKVLGTLENSRGGNAVVLVPELNRGWVVSLDGSATPFDLSTRKTGPRVKFGDDADNGVYDPATRQLVVSMGDSRHLAFLDPMTGALEGKLQLDSEKIEGMAPDGTGKLFVALRDRDKVVRVDVLQRKLESEYPTAPGCEQPNGLAFDGTNRRILVGCRGKNPVLAVMDAQSGRVVATTAIGRGNDMVVFDSAQHRIYASNGVDANLVVIDQENPDTYRMVEATATRPNARTMALDPKTKNVYLVTAEGTVDGSKEWSRAVAPFYPNTYFKDTFTLLTLARH